jgi:hypothetical protein
LSMHLTKKIILTKINYYIYKHLKQTIMKKQNTYIGGNLGRIVKYWTKKSTPETKGGSFNVDLYLQYLNAINK